MSKFKTALKNLNHEELIKLIKDRDPQFLDQLFTELNPILIKITYANQIFKPHTEDLIHQTWQKFFENFEAFEGRSSLSTFVTGILINKIREHRRAVKKFVYEEDGEKIYSQSFTSEGWWINEPVSPDKWIESVELQKMVEDCLEGLSEQQKTAFVLKEIEEENSENICNVLGISLSNLRVLIFRAKDKLKSCIQGLTESKEV
ncbi:MAG: sigma-70 family RNA polymerase sigma factor [Pseudobdellovibrio sp.]